MGICNLRHIDDEIAKRKIVAERYDERLGEQAGIQIRRPQKAVRNNYAYYPIVIDENAFGKTRNEIFAALGQENIHARKYFYPLTNTFDCFHGSYDVSHTPVALKTSKRVLTLPMYADLDTACVDRICDIVLQ